MSGPSDFVPVFRKRMERPFWREQSYAIILAHNHPSESLAPSYEDIVVTEKFREAGRYLEIGLLDHLVITRNGFTSIRGTSPEIFERKGDA